MRKTIPAKEITACDLCERDASFLQKCVRCEREYCHTCEAIIAGCIHQPNVCRRCAENDGVIKAVLKFSDPLVALLKKRDASIKRVKFEK